MQTDHSCSSAGLSGANDTSVDVGKCLTVKWLELNRFLQERDMFILSSVCHRNYMLTSQC